MRLRQVVVAAEDLAATRAAIEDQLALPHVWADPGVAHFGLRNALYAVGDTFLEVVSPFRDDAPARRFLERAGRDAGYMAIVQTTDPLDEIRRRAQDLDIRIVFEADGEGITGLHLHPSDTGGTLLSIDRCEDRDRVAMGGPRMGVGARSGLLGDHRRDLCGPVPIGGGGALGRTARHREHG